jgi:sulfur relay (sulfurtransferase) DsrC/TusE family protein
MTKKSQNRLARDAAQAQSANSEPNRCWDELNGIYNKCQTAITDMEQRVIALYSVEGLAKYLDHRTEVVALLRGLRNDKDEFQRELTEIHSKHADRSGGSEESYLDRESLEIFENYRNWYAKFEAVFVPTVEHLIAHITAVGQKIVAIKTAEQAQTNQESEVQ